MQSLNVGMPIKILRVYKPIFGIGLQSFSESFWCSSIVHKRFSSALVIEDDAGWDASINQKATPKLHSVASTP